MKGVEIRDLLPNPARTGVLAAGNFIVDRIIIIDRYPFENTLASIEAETLSSGGCPYSVLKDLAILGAAFPLAALGALGTDDNADWIRADCERYGIDTARMTRIDGAVTSYTYAMTVRETGRRTFFHQRGANALLAREHFDFTASRARIFMFGYLALLDSLDVWVTPGVTGAAQILKSARAAGMLTVVDMVSAPHPQFTEIIESALPHVDHLLCNELEAGMALGRPVSTEPADLLCAARELAVKGVRQSVVIHCEHGVLGFDCETAQATAHGAVALPDALVKGATGAGDAFAAGYVWSLHAGEPMAERLRAGVCCAAACLRDGSASGALEAFAGCLDLGARFGFHPFTLTAD